MNVDEPPTPLGDQEGRNAKSRREMARAAGVALINATVMLEEEAIFDRDVGPMGIVMITLAARGRRLLRSFYRLVDAGERSEAAPLLRVMHEYLIVLNWLLLDPEKNLTLWIKDDLRRRDVVRDRLVADPDIGDEVKRVVEDERSAEREAARALLAAAIEEEAEPADHDPCPTCGRPRARRERGVPSVEQMAAKSGMSFAYDLGYRMQSQADVHATALAIDNTLIRQPDGSIMIRPAPDFGLSAYDSYQLGAHMLLDLIRPISDRWSDLGWGPIVGAAAGSLDAIAQSDPAWRSRPDSEAIAD
jgi:hypothetical protein